MRLAVLLLLFALGANAKHHKHRVPVMDTRGADSLVASIREDASVLDTVPDLAIVQETGPVCSYVISSETDGVVPFEAQVVDRYSGAAVIRLKDSAVLDCKDKEYHLSVAAVRCDDENSKSESVPLKVTVKDTNNHEPQFESPWYTFIVEEGKIHKEIAHLKASDADCGDPFGTICEYEITNGLKDFPFSIDDQGVLSNTKALNYSQSKSYILTVVAHDCGQRKSKSALVTVNVKEACVAGVRDFNDRVNYQAGSEKKALVPDAQIFFCEKETGCEVSSVSATVSLRAGHVSSGCSKESVFSNQTMHKCGLSPKTVTLLDANSHMKDSYENDVTEKSGINFDGTSSAFEVPQNTFQGLIPDKFTLSFSLRHEKGSKSEQNNKQNIICESDASGMNRHHFSVYLRHCKLEVVLRREHGAAPEFRAAEWRFASPEVCDGDWHSYALLFDGVDNVHLMVDGNTFKADDRNPEILDDWPLHKMSAESTKLVVGACWHARQNQMTQHLRGDLANVRLVAGVTESQAAIRCVHQCPDHLIYLDGDQLFDSESVTNSMKSPAMTVKAPTIQRAEHMLQKIAYWNKDLTPTPGHRSFFINTQVHCKAGNIVNLAASKGYVFVQKRADPTLSISGFPLVNTDHKAVKIGTAMIPDVKIVVSQTSPDGSVSDVSAQHKLDFCQVHLKPSRDMDVEYFSSPASLVASLSIDFEHDKEGIMLRGAETVKGYMEVLSKVHYFNTRPESYNKRMYSVKCGMLKGRVVSNEFLITMTISAPLETTTSLPVPALPLEDMESLEMIERHFEPAFDQMGASRLQNILEMDLPRPKALLSHHGYDVGQGAVAGGAVAVVVVVCVGFLLVLLVIGVLKMRDAPLPRKSKKKKNDDGLHWDDSGMNITVNPLEDVEKQGMADYSDDESSDGDESDCTFHDEDDITDEEEGPEVLPHMENQRTGLEWDDEAALAHSSRSYRV